MTDQTTTMRARSRASFTSEAATRDDINTGSLQRIADGVEAMAKNYVRFEMEAAEAKRARDYCRNEADRLARQLIAQRGVVTKLKKRIAQLIDLYASRTTEPASGGMPLAEAARPDEPMKGDKK